MKTPILSSSVLLLVLVALIMWAGSTGASVPANAPFDPGSTMVPSGQFKLDDIGDSYLLTYAWKNYQADPYTIEFALTKTAVKESNQEFGYYPAELERFTDEEIRPLQEAMIRSLRAFTLQLIAGSPHSLYLNIQDKDDLSFSLKMSVPSSVSNELRAEIKNEFDLILSALAKEQKKQVKNIEKEKRARKKIFMQAHGFRLDGDKYVVDYSLVAHHNKVRIQSVISAMRQAYSNLSFNKFLSMLLSFVQEINYGTPPIKDNDKIIFGFWPPLKVLVNNYGDCDSKGVVFASLWLNYRKYPLLLIKIPRHLFIGLAIPSFRGEDISIGGLKYTFCEVTGPEKTLPGMISRYSRLYLESGRYRYEMIK